MYGMACMVCCETDVPLNNVLVVPKMRSALSTTRRIKASAWLSFHEDSCSGLEPKGITFGPFWLERLRLCTWDVVVRYGLHPIRTPPRPIDFVIQAQRYGL